MVAAGSRVTVAAGGLTAFTPSGDALSSASRLKDDEGKASGLCDRAQNCTDAFV